MGERFSRQTARGSRGEQGGIVMKRKDQDPSWKMKKYTRWVRRSCYRSYKRLVRMIEHQLGGRMDSC